MWADEERSQRLMTVVLRGRQGEIKAEIRVEEKKKPVSIM